MPYSLHINSFHLELTERVHIQVNKFSVDLLIDFKSPAALPSVTERVIKYVNMWFMLN